MKTILNSLKFMSFACLFLVSCKKVDGPGTGPKFQESLTMTKEGGDATITAKNNVGWWFNYLKLNGEDVHWEDESLTYFYTKEIDKESPYDQTKQPDIYKIKGEWFSIEKIDNKKINISLNANNEEFDRKLQFGIQAGNAFGGVEIVQTGVNN